MRTIWKYELLRADLFSIEMPKGAEILDVQIQHGKPYLWALVDNAAKPEKRTFCLYGTGHPVNHIGGKYLGTFQVEGGALVFHLFEPAI